MGELYVEGVATHGGPESCVDDPRGRGEALTGVRAGRAIEPRNHSFGVPTLCKRWKATPPAALSRVAGGPRAVREPGHVRNLHAREPGDPALARPVDHRAGRSGNARWYAWDERAWEVGRSRSTCEPAEQGPGCGRGGGGGGGKGIGQGEHGQQNASRTQCRARGVQCAGSCAGGSTTRQGCAVHGAAAPRRPGPAPEGLLGDPPAGRAGGGRGDVGRVRAGPGGQPAGSARSGAGGALPGQAEQAGVHPEGGRAATPVGYRLAGGQDRPAGRRRGVERRLRGGLPGLLLRVPAGAQAP